MTYEDQVRRQMEEEANTQAQGTDCPITEDVDAAFGFREAKKKLTKRGFKGLKRGGGRSIIAVNKKTGGFQTVRHKGRMTSGNP